MSTFALNDRFLTAPISVNADVVQLALPGDTSGCSIAITGTWTGTVQFEASGDMAGNFNAVNATPSNSATPATSATANGLWRVPVSGYTHIRVRASATITGAAQISLSASRGGIGI